jgi:membrane associated rhomboid family serine protease
VYRILTSALSHSSLIHLAMNCLALTSIAPPLERSLGSLQLAWLMLLLAVLSGVLYVLVAAAFPVLPTPP